ncbi:MAG: histidine kinase [Opitutaceae bacterium]
MNVTKIVFCLFAALSLQFMGLAHADELPDFSKTKLRDLEHRKLEIQDTLNGLAIPSLNSGVGAVGYRSLSYEDPEHEEWVQVDLLESGKVDAIVLVPTLWRDTQLGFIADNVPDEFRLVAGTKKHPEGEIIYEHSVAKNALIGIAPLFIPVSRDEVSWVRVEVSRLAARHFDGRYIFQLSELMVFDGDVNRALRKPVSSSWRVDESASWNGTVLVDGVLPYLMNSATGEQSRAYVSPVGVGEKPSITIDLGKIHEVDGLRLYAADQSDTVPAANAGEFGLPEHFILEGANKEDFSDASLLVEGKMQSIFEMGPILSWNFPVQKVRYVRVTALVPFLYSGRVEGTRISFTEIEILSQGKNLAKGKPVSASFDITTTRQPISTLTDGRNLYGDILPQREWLEQLTFRHKLEQELAALELELDSRYVFQKKMLRLVIILAVCLLLIIVFSIPYYRMRSLRNEVNIRERIAANLHDELGANLHAIGMLGDVAERSIESPGRLIEAVRRIRGLTERTGAAARYCTNMLEAKSICEDLVVEMKHDAARLLSDHEYRIMIHGEEALRLLTRRRRVDLYLFFKECLTNINRHAKATKVYVRLTATSSELSLSVIDNGLGYTGELPKALSRRARLMGAIAEARTTSPHGTHIRLKLKLRKFKFLP